MGVSANVPVPVRPALSPPWSDGARQGWEMLLVGGIAAALSYGVASLLAGIV